MKEEETYSNYVSSMTEKQLKEYIKTVGKAANQRLRELESQGLTSSSAAYRYIQKITFDEEKAKKGAEVPTASTMGRTAAGEIKFNLRVRGKTMGELRHEVATIEGFMNARSSTVTGVKAIYKDAADTFERTHGKEYTKGDYARFAEALSYTLFRTFERIYGSEIALEVSQKADQGGLSIDEIEEALREAGFTEDTTEDNAPAVNEVMQKIDEFIANKKDVEADEEGLYTGNIL